MRWSRFALWSVVWWLTITPIWCQLLPDFSLAIDPAALDKVTIFEQMDTIRSHRKAINFQFLESEFPMNPLLRIETFYQKSITHHLLRMGDIRISPTGLYLMVEGWGTTYFKITDGHCTVITALSKGTTEEDLQLYKECIL